MMKKWGGRGGHGGHGGMMGKMKGMMKMLFPKRGEFYMADEGDDCGAPPADLMKGNAMKEACKQVKNNVALFLAST